MKALVQEENKLRQNKKVKVVYDQKRDYPVKTLLKISGIPRNTYYYKINTFEHSDKNSKWKRLISSIFEKHKGRYGYRRILFSSLIFTILKNL